MNEKKPSVAELIEYFESGCKNEKLLGLELEHFIVDKKTRRSLPYYGGVELLLTRLQPLYGEAIISDMGNIIGVSNERANITLEPAAQFEISAAPSADLSEIKNIYDEFTNIVTPLLDEINCEFVCLGYHPKSIIDELPLIPKSRYNHMYSHFEKTGNCGKNMMKGSAAAQVNIDYSSEADFKKKFRVSCVMGPLIAFICDNTPIFEGKPYDGNMARTYIWNNVDPARSGIPPGALDMDYGFGDYAEYIYNMPDIYVPENESEYMEHCLSMVFPDVRLKTRLELRMADSMPIDAAMDFMKLLSAMFYNEQRLNDFYKMTEHIKNSDVDEAKASLMRDGQNAVVYGKTAAEWITEIFKNGGSYEEFKRKVRRHYPQQI